MIYNAYIYLKTNIKKDKNVIIKPKKALKKLSAFLFNLL